MNLPNQIIDLKDLKEDVNALIYGPSDVGKTTLAGTIADNVILRLEKGAISAKLSKGRAKNVKVWPISTIDEFEQAIKWLRSNTKSFKWVTVDSVTQLQRMIVRDILMGAHSSNPMKFDIDTMQLQHYGKLQAQLKRYIEDLNDLPMNILYLATEMEIKNKDGLDVLYPNLSGKKGEVSKSIVAMMQVVGFYAKTSSDNGEIIRRLAFEEILPDEDLDKPGIYARDRFNVLPEVVDIAIGNEQATTLGKLFSSFETDEDIAPNTDNDFGDAADDNDEEVEKPKAKPKTSSSRFKPMDDDGEE